MFAAPLVICFFFGLAWSVYTQVQNVINHLWLFQVFSIRSHNKKANSFFLTEKYKKKLSCNQNVIHDIWTISVQNSENGHQIPHWSMYKNQKAKGNRHISLCSTQLSLEGSNGNLGNNLFIEHKVMFVQLLERFLCKRINLVLVFLVHHWHCVQQHEADVHQSQEVAPVPHHRDDP